MKVLYYNHTGQVSGAERVLLMILARLDRSRVEPVVVCPPDGPLADMCSELNVRTVELEPLKARFTWRIDRLIKYVWSFIRVIQSARALAVSESPDLIHANSIRAGLVMTAATVGTGNPVIWHAHDILPRHPLSVAVRWFFLASRRTRILAVSRAVADRFHSAVARWTGSATRVTIVHNAVDLERFHPDSNNRHETRRALGIAESELVIGSVGQLTPRKGQRELINAFARIAEVFPQAMVMIAGAPLFNRDQEYAESLGTLVNSLGLADRVRFLGARKDVPDLMQAFDLLVVNSREEPFALTVLEGLASGTPVLATAVGGIPEMIRHEENGWLVAPHDSKALANAMGALLADANARTQIGQRGRERAESEFSIQRFLAEGESLYRRTLERGKMPHRESFAVFQLSAD